MKTRLMIVSVSVALLSLMCGCAPTSGDNELLEEMPAPQPGADNNPNNTDVNEYKHLTTASTVGDVVNNPAFKGFGQYILPLQWRYDPAMKLSEIPSVMRRRVEALQRLGIDAEFHLFPDLRHGFGPGTGTGAEGWTSGAVSFWEKHIHK